MLHRAILNNVDKHISLNTSEQDLFTNLLIPKVVQKKEIVLQPGQLCRNIYFVNSGLLRAYYLNQDGKDFTMMFAIQDWWITDMYAFANEHPSVVAIEALKKSELFKLSKAHMDTLFENIPKFERFFRILFQNAYIREQLRMIQNLSFTAEDRYHNFLSKYPQIVPYLTQKQIASYLGITPEFLSAIRGSKK